MGAKAGLEYAAVNVRLDVARAKYGPNPALAEAANGMAAEGWTLVSCSHPQLDWTIMTFSRPRRPDAMAAEGRTPVEGDECDPETRAEVERLERAAGRPGGA